MAKKKKGMKKGRVTPNGSDSRTAADTALTTQVHHIPPDEAPVTLSSLQSAQHHKSRHGSSLEARSSAKSTESSIGKSITTLPIRSTSHHFGRNYSDTSWEGNGSGSIDASNRNSLSDVSHTPNNWSRSPGSTPFVPFVQPSTTATQAYGPRVQTGPIVDYSSTERNSQYLSAVRPGLKRDRSAGNDKLLNWRREKSPQKASFDNLPKGNSNTTRQDVSFHSLDLRIQSPGRNNYKRVRDMPLPPPSPTIEYMLRSENLPKKLEHPQPLLVILDLNGTLVHRPDRKQPHKFVGRPRVSDFLKYLLSRYSVMIWSSARPENVKLMCDKLFNDEQRSKLVAEWGRDQLDLTPVQYNQKVQVYKRLGKVWCNPSIAKGYPEVQDQLQQSNTFFPWDQSNTILIDDTSLKAAAQPFNLVEIPEFTNRPNQLDTDILAQVVSYLEELRCQVNVSSFMRTTPFKINDGWNFAWPQAEAGSR